MRPLIEEASIRHDADGREGKGLQSLQSFDDRLTRSLQRADADALV
jgi:hypothetical protein